MIGLKFVQSKGMCWFYCWWFPWEMTLGNTEKNWQRPGRTEWHVNRQLASVFVSVDSLLDPHFRKQGYVPPPLVSNRMKFVALRQLVCTPLRPEVKHILFLQWDSLPQSHGQYSRLPVISRLRVCCQQLLLSLRQLLLALQIQNSFCSRGFVAGFYIAIDTAGQTAGSRSYSKVLGGFLHDR